MNKFTPLHIEILFYYNSCNKDLVGVNSDGSRLHDAIQQLKETRLLGNCTRAESNVSYDVTDKGRAVIEYMCNTPMPVQEWKFPERGGDE